jgi:ubiquinone/menaquinone biosynthesis C-methylase UbiE
MDDKTGMTISTYSKTVKDYESKTGNLYFHEELNFLKTQLPPGSHLLDHGCGPGRDAEFLTRAGYQVTGLDLCQEMVDFASKRAPLANFKLGDIRNLEFANSTFDGIWSIASLLHLSKQELPSALEEMNRVLKPGGMLFTVLKEGEGEKISSDERYNPPRKKYYSLFQQNELEQFLTAAKFNIIRSRIETWDSDYINHREIRIFCKK